MHDTFRLKSNIIKQILYPDLYDTEFKIFPQKSVPKWDLIFLISITLCGNMNKFIIKTNLE